MPQTIHRSALGRVAEIGALYDARTDSFVASSLFSSKLGDDDIGTMENDDASLEILTDSLQEKFKQYNVDSELQASVLTGLVQPRGSGAYLKENQKSVRSQSVGLMYKIETLEEDIDIRKHKDKVNKNILLEPDEHCVDATHVVVGITWGAYCVVTCEYENIDYVYESKVQAELLKQINKIKLMIESECPDNTEDLMLQENNLKLSFTCYSDLTPIDKGLPVTFDGAAEIVKNLQGLVEVTDKGKGVPVGYTLMPLDAVAKACKVKMRMQKQYTPIDENVVERSIQVASDIAKTHQTLTVIYNDLTAFADYMKEESLKQIKDVLHMFRDEASGFKGKLQELVQEVKSGKQDQSLLKKFLYKDLSGTIDLSWYTDQIGGFQKAIEKTTIVRSWMNKGIVYIGKEDKLQIRKKGIIYILYKSNEKDIQKETDKSLELFQRLYISHGRDKESYKFIVIDQEVRSDLWKRGLTNSTIHKYKGGVEVSTDVYADVGKDTERCYIQVTSPKSQKRRPDKRAHVKLRCPNALSGNGLCSGNPLSWMCSICNEVVEYGTETKLFHCKCGSSDPKQALFRCNEKDHGMEYITYPDDILMSDLSTHKAMKEKNILILGETGVGKSTWINGFINYLYFSDMEEAINAEEFHVLIPSSFTFTQKGKEKLIKVGGTDSNENMETGKSATKEPRSYIFHVGGEIVRLIDTPGVGDSGGIQHDKKNFDNILSFLTYYEEIHAVCILLKPNNARLTVMFRFCIQELLAHLHTSAKNNIVFCFTNARATFYQPGDTLPALNKELNDRNVGIQATEDNYFCFDNEPFRFLACVKSGVEFSQSDINTYADSWNKSVEETKRLFNYIGSLKPHRIRNTLNMNEARRIIVAMSKPLAEVAKTIQHNLQEGTEAKLQIDLAVKDMAEMQSKLHFSGYGVKRTELGYPRTVCTHPKCIDHIQVGQTRVQNTMYKQICHHHCGLSGIPTETTNDQRLAGCWAMSGPNCHQCGHHYTVHMHITYHTEIFREDFLSQDVQDQINQKNTIKAQKEAFKRAIDIKNRELLEEEKIIMKTSAKYGSFLKANAIIPYNDAVGDYLDMSIEQERNKSKDIRNDALIVTLEDMKNEYLKERKILDGAIGTDTGDNISSPEEVMKLQRKLFGLKHMGKTLKDLFEGISISHSAKNISFQEKRAPVRQNRKKRRGLGSTINPLVSRFVNYIWPTNAPSPDHADRRNKIYVYSGGRTAYNDGYRYPSYPRHTQYASTSNGHNDRYAESGAEASGYSWGDTEMLYQGDGQGDWQRADSSRHSGMEGNTHNPPPRHSDFTDLW